MKMPDGSGSGKTHTMESIELVFKKVFYQPDKYASLIHKYDGRSSMIRRATRILVQTFNQAAASASNGSCRRTLETVESSI